MKKQQLIVFIFLLSSVFITAQSWIPVGNANGFSDTTAADQHLALDSNNVLYIAYQNTSGATLNTTVKKFNGTTWETLGQDTQFAAHADHHDLIIDTNDIPYLTYKDYDNGQKTVVLKFDVTASVKNQVLQAQVTLYPNPIIEKVYVNSSTLSIQKLEVYNVLGKRLIKGVNKTTLKVSELATGIYLLKITTDKGVLTKKIIKK